MLRSELAKFQRNSVVFFFVIFLLFCGGIGAQFRRIRGPSTTGRDRWRRRRSPDASFHVIERWQKKRRNAKFHQRFHASNLFSVLSSGASIEIQFLKNRR